MLMQSKRILFSFITVLLLLISFPVSAHNMAVGGSRWCFGKNGIIGTIDLSPSLLSEIKGIKEGRYDLDSISDIQLQQIAGDILQPYVDKKLTITVNDTKYPVKVAKIVRSGTLFSIWLSVESVNFNSQQTR